MREPTEPGFFARANAFVRRVLLTVAVVVAALAGAWIVAQNRVGGEIRREVERQFASRYPGYRVRVLDARLVEGRGIQIYGLSLTRRPESDPVVSVDEIVVDCSACLEGLLRGERPPARQIVLRGLKLRARQDADGAWDVAELWPPPEFGSHSPRIIVRDGLFRLSSREDNADRLLELRDLHLQVELGSGGAEAAMPLRIQGQASGNWFHRLSFEALVDAQRGDWQGRGSLAGLRLGPELYAALPEPWRSRSIPLAALTGEAQLDFQVSGSREQDLPGQFSIDGRLEQGQIADRRLPYRLYDVRARFHCDNQRLNIKHFSARNGVSELELSLVRDGWADDSPLALQARARRLSLDRRFSEALPPPLQTAWRQYFPTGLIDADLRLDFDGRDWRPEFLVQCDDVSFVHHRFPYRVEQAHGTVSLKDDLLSVNLQAAAGGQAVTLHAQVQSPGAEASGWLEISCQRPIPLDNKLLDAITDPHARQVIRSLNPAGSLTFAGRFERRAAGEQVHKFLRVDLHHCNMRYDGFPYPLRAIRGTMIWDDHGWTFQNLSGRNDSGYVECEGNWAPLAEGGSLLRLNFVATDVPLEDELRDALKPEAQQIWNELQPRGALDQLQIALEYASAHHDLTLQVQARKWKRRPYDEGRSITVHPRWFPYRLDDATGVVSYRDGEILLEGLSAQHENTAIGLEGRCRVEADRSWTVELSKVTAEGLHLDQELLAALPEGLGRGLGRLALRGNLSLEGALAIRGATGMSRPTALDWDLAIDVENGRLNCGPQLENVHGDIRLVGSSQGGVFSSRGELRVDSLVYKDLQLTQLRGPLLIEPTRVVLGAEAERDRVDAPPRSLTAEAIGGEISADAVVYFEGDVPFRLSATLHRGDLQQFAREMALKNQSIRGKANAGVTLSGTGQGRHSWRGDGFVRLYEADIYEVPVMLALLKLLSIRQPDRTAFSSSEIDFNLQGEHLYLKRIHLDGDAFRLRGHGDMSLNRQIDLKFYALVGRREWDTPPLRALLQQAAPRILMIHATGSLDQPHLTPEALPMLRETLEQIFPEVAARQNARRLAR